jgi:hypothetical protein
MLRAFGNSRDRDGRRQDYKQQQSKPCHNASDDGIHRAFTVKQTILQALCVISIKPVPFDFSFDF